MKILDNRDSVGSLLLLFFAVFYLIQTTQVQLDPTTSDEFFTPRTLPIGLSISTIILCLVQIAISDKSIRFTDSITGYAWAPVISLAILMLAYSLLFSYLGFLLATILFLLGGFFILGERNIWTSILVSVGLSVSIWLIFTQLFELYLDKGVVIHQILEALK